MPIIPATPLPAQDSRGVVTPPSNQPGNGAVIRASEVMTGISGLPQDSESQRKLSTAVATNMIQQQIVDPNGRGSPNMQAAMGNGANNTTLYVTSDPNSPNARVAQTNIVEVQAQSQQTLQTNLTAAVNNSQQATLAPVVNAPGLTASAPATDQPGGQVTRSL